MRRIVLFLIIILSSATLSSCEKDDDAGVEYYQFEATVKGKGQDCGDTYLVDLKKLDGASEIANGLYYADNLPLDLKVAGQKIRLNSRKPTDDELYACTTMGPGYSHLIVLDSKKVE